MGSSMLGGAGPPPPRYSNNIGMPGGSANDPAVIENAISNSQDPNTVGDLFNKYSQSFNQLQERQGGSPAIMSGLDRGRMNPQWQPQAPSQFANQNVVPGANEAPPPQMNFQDMQQAIQAQFPQGTGAPPIMPNTIQANTGWAPGQEMAQQGPLPGQMGDPNLVAPSGPTPTIPPKKQKAGTITDPNVMTTNTGSGF